MNKKCARCDKTVYPIEELKCLDKIWHKLCFKCEKCGMTLNMRTYKGFNKMPYCEAHIPKAIATTMAETPELKRIAENTKIQSNVKYHAEFEKAKGKFTQVADDPETLRIKQNSKIISNVAYHGELEKKAIMEQKRTLFGENGEQITEVLPEEPTPRVNSVPPMPPSTPNSNSHGYNHALPAEYPQHHSNHNSGAIPGKISDYDPLADVTRNSPYSARQSSTLIYSSDQGPVSHRPQHIGSVADMDPVNDCYGSLSDDYRGQQGSRPAQEYYSQSADYKHQPMKQTVLPGKIYQAMYDYDAQDSDEVSFVDGDIILNCHHVDEGWMIGIVKRTGKSGMLPANYVKTVN